MSAELSSVDLQAQFEADSVTGEGGKPVLRVIDFNNRMYIDLKDVTSYYQRMLWALSFQLFGATVAFVGACTAWEEDLGYIAEMAAKDLNLGEVGE